MLPPLLVSTLSGPWAPMGKSPADTRDVDTPARPARTGQPSCPGTCCGLKLCVLGQVAEPLWARISSSRADWGVTCAGRGGAKAAGLRKRRGLRRGGRSTCSALGVLGARRARRSPGRPACGARRAPRSGSGAAIMSTAMNFGSKSFQPRPPDKGSFPLDHFGERREGGGSRAGASGLGPRQAVRGRGRRRVGAAREERPWQYVRSPVPKSADR